jgi:polyisoprenoid-binding protein YceI
MALPTGTHTLGPASGSLQVKTYREGVAALVGHDLVIDVTAWEATVAVGDDGALSTLELHVDPRSLRVRDGLRGAKPLTDKDRADIAKTIDERVLRGQPIDFRSTAVEPSGRVSGELTLGGTRRPTSFDLTAADGRLAGAATVTQTAWGIKPYRGLMGALKVRDDVEIVVDVAVA